MRRAPDGEYRNLVESAFAVDRRDAQSLSSNRSVSVAREGENAPMAA